MLRIGGSLLGQQLVRRARGCHSNARVLGMAAAALQRGPCCLQRPDAHTRAWAGSTHALHVQARLMHTQESGYSEHDKLSLREKLTLMTKQYGKVTIGVYLVYDAISLGMFYTALRMGVDIGAVLGKLGLDAPWLHSGGSTLVIAYAVHKVFAPVRVVLTVGSTPSVVRMATRWGWIKPSPSARDVKTELTERKDEYMDHYRERAEQWMHSFQRTRDRHRRKWKKYKDYRKRR